MDEELQKLLEAAFPAETDLEIVRAVTEGVLLADDLVNNTPLLKTPVGADMRGHLRRAGIMFRVHDLCFQGLLPFKADFLAMPHGPLHWLEMTSGSFKAHICRTDGALEFPEETLSRQDERLRNQLDLFAPSVVPIRQAAKAVRQFYAWLTFGADKSGRILHVCWAMPPSDPGEWLAHINVLERMSKAASPPTVPASTEELEKKLTLRFRDHVQETFPAKDKDKKDTDNK